MLVPQARRLAVSLAEKETEAGGPATHADEAVPPEQETPAKSQHTGITQ